MRRAPLGTHYVTAHRGEVRRALATGQRQHAAVQGGEQRGVRVQRPAVREARGAHRHVGDGDMSCLLSSAAKILPTIVLPGAVVVAPGSSALRGRTPASLIPVLHARCAFRCRLCGHHRRRSLRRRIVIVR